MESKKPPLFTPRSARDAAQALRPTMADALRLYRALTRRAPAPGCAERPVDATYFAGVRLLVQVVERMQAAGAEVDLSRARLRFPARRHGRDVHLRWDLAEPQALWLGELPAAEDAGWEESR
ncbi:MAG TPA: hypothetical protein VFO11_11820 [Candidatus Polarisedimenticolaceae bacterium]|nr:hypothetical protein [Candidatus Polarisedimenticolaceae bacterium]